MNWLEARMEYWLENMRRASMTKDFRDKGGPRVPTSEELDSWFDDGKQVPPSNHTRESIRSAIKSRNPVRFNRMMRDFRWMQKQMKKMGLNPEDARWLL